LKAEMPKGKKKKTSRTGRGRTDTSYKGQKRIILVFGGRKERKIKKA